MKKTLERNVRIVANTAAEYLPFDPQGAVDAGLRGLEERNIQPDMASVSVSSDRKTLKISAVSEVRAYFAWMVGQTTLRFGAAAQANVSIKGGGPVAELPTKEISFGFMKPKRFKLGQNLAFVPESPEAPEWGLRLYSLSGVDKTLVTVGQEIEVEPFRSLGKFGSPGVRKVVIISRSDTNTQTSKVLGFAVLQVRGFDDKAGMLRGQFVKKRLDGEPSRRLTSANDFGAWMGGTTEVTVTAVDN